MKHLAALVERCRRYHRLYRWYYPRVRLAVALLWLATLVSAGITLASLLGLGGVRLSTGILGMIVFPVFAYFRYFRKFYLWVDTERLERETQAARERLRAMNLRYEQLAREAADVIDRIRELRQRGRASADDDGFGDVEQPDHSRRRLEVFEKQYGMASDTFYSLYQRGEAPVDRETAERWAFEYEVHQRAREMMLQR